MVPFYWNVHNKLVSFDCPIEVRAHCCVMHRLNTLKLMPLCLSLQHFSWCIQLDSILELISFFHSWCHDIMIFVDLKCQNEIPKHNASSKIFISLKIESLSFYANTNWQIAYDEPGTCWLCNDVTTIYGTFKFAYMKLNCNLGFDDGICLQNCSKLCRNCTNMHFYLYYTQ